MIWRMLERQEKVTPEMKECVERLFEIPSGYGSSRVVVKVSDFRVHDRFPLCCMFPRGHG